VFYGYRDQDGNLQGVAMMGHFILFETRTEAAIEAFAAMAQTHKKVHLLLGEQEKVQTFWRYYHEGGQNPRLQCRELLFELRWASEPKEPVEGLRLATRDDLDLVVPVHARTAFEESGMNPLDFDPEGFRERCARRIDKGQSWVWIDEGKLIFKAEIVADTPDVIYLEGVDVNPEERGKGYGSRCVAQLCSQLLTRTSAILVLVNEKSPGAVQFYREAGFRLLDCYDTIFMEKKYN
jgi:GNAT superfamily N-acetyltransferase